MEFEIINFIVVLGSSWILDILNGDIVGDYDDIVSFGFFLISDGLIDVIFIDLVFLNCFVIVNLALLLLCLDICVI